MPVLNLKVKQTRNLSIRGIKNLYLIYSSYRLFIKINYNSACYRTKLLDNFKI